MRRIVENLGLLLGAGLLLAGVGALHQLRPSADFSIEQAQFSPGGAPDAPPAAQSTTWKSVPLPDDWQPDRRELRSGWYRLEVAVPKSPREVWALYLPSVSMNAAVWLNGRQLGSGGSMQPPVARNWSRPLYFLIPEGLLREGPNEVWIRIASIPIGAGLLSEFYLGPDAELRFSYDGRFALKITLVQAITGLLFAIAIFMGLLAWRDRDPVYLSYASGAGLWAIHNLNLFVRVPPLPDQAWDWLWRVTLVGLAAVVVPFTNHFQGRPQPAVEKGGLMAAGLGALALAALPAEAFYAWGRMALDLLALCLGVVSLVRAFSAPRQGPEARWLWLTGATLALFAIHDFAAVTGRISRVEGYYLQYATLPIFVVFTSILLLRFMRALDRSEALSRELAARIAERERMTREMHDGLGAGLVSTLAMVEDGQTHDRDVAGALRESLDELRMMLHSMEGENDDLSSAMGLLRERIENRVAASGLEVLWQVRDLPPIPNFGSSQILNVLRVVQEAVANVIKHADAKTLRVETGEAPRQDGARGIFVSVQDDGVGCDPNATRGYGLRNMRARAAELGGEFSLEPASPGTRARLWIPLSRT